jgi:hypothetical protein
VKLGFNFMAVAFEITTGFKRLTTFNTIFLRPIEKTSGDLVEKVKLFAIHAHQETNHTNDGKPYSVHLQLAVSSASNTSVYCCLKSNQAKCWRLFGCRM